MLDFYLHKQDYLMDVQRDPIKSRFCKLRLLCRSLAGNNVYYLTVTAPPTDDELSRVRTVFLIFCICNQGFKNDCNKHRNLLRSFALVRESANVHYSNIISCSQIF